MKEANVEVTAAEEQQQQQPGEGDEEGEGEGGQQGGTRSLVLLWLPFSDFTCP
jgi:hypothetical protein